MYSARQQLPLLSMDQTELQRRMEEKVAEMIAPPVENTATATCCKTSFLSSSVLKQYMAHEEADQANSDCSSKVSNIYYFHVHCHQNYYL